MGDKKRFVQIIFTIIFGAAIQLMTPFGNVNARPYEELKQNVVKILAHRSGQAYHGFGIIIGQRADSVFIVTANHVVRGDKPDQKADSVKVAYYEDQELKSAQLLGFKDVGLDIAFIAAHFPDSLKWRVKSIDLKKKYKPGTEAWFIGKDQDWYAPAVPGAIDEIDSTNHIVSVTGVDIAPGTSGAPLITNQGIIGMIYSDRTAGELKARPVEQLHTIAEKHNIRWQLEKYKGSNLWKYVLGAVGGSGLTTLVLYTTGVFGGEEDTLDTGPPDFPRPPQ